MSNEMILKLKNMIRFGRVTRPGKDNGADTISQVESMGRAVNVTMLYPYGISANAPENSTVLIFAAGGSAQNMAALAMFPENRKPDLKPGEIAIGNMLSKALVFFKEDGEIEIKTGTSIVTVKKDGAIRCETAGGFFELAEGGQLNVNGNLTVDP